MSGLPLIEHLKGRLRWLPSQQKMLAEVVPNADTPRFKPRDLREFHPGGQSGLATVETSAAHLCGFGGSKSQASRNTARSEIIPFGNSENLEDEIVKIAETRADYQVVATLYSKSLTLLSVRKRSWISCARWLLPVRDSRLRLAAFLLFPRRSPMQTQRPLSRVLTLTALKSRQPGASLTGSPKPKPSAWGAFRSEVPFLSVWACSCFCRSWAMPSSPI